MTEYAPVVLFVYNRLPHTIQTLEALQNNALADESDLYIFSDGPKSDHDIEKVEKVRDYIDSATGFRNIYITKRDRNLGLAQSIISGVTEIIKKYGKVVVIEDDLITSSDFLGYMNDGLNYFEDDPRIFSVTGYTPSIEIPSYYKEDIFLFHRISSYGWGTWTNRWDLVDWDIKDFDEFILNQNKRQEFNKGGEDLTAMLLKQMKGNLDSWAIRFTYNCFKRGMYNVYPVYSKVFNTGYDDSGVHGHKTRKYDTVISDRQIRFSECHADEIIEGIMRRFYSKRFYRRLINYLTIMMYVITTRIAC